MFSQLPGNDEGGASSFSLKMIAIGACGLLLGLGVCGLGALVNRSPNSYFGAVSFIGFAIFGLSALTLAIGVLLLILVSILRVFGG